jgi:hypothetical protein
VGDVVENVSGDKYYWGGYDLQARYVTTRDLLFDGRELDVAFYWPLNGGARRRVEFGEFVAKRADYPGIVLVPAGARFKISVIQKRFSFEYTALEIYGVFLDGALAGRTFSAGGVSETGEGLDEWGVYVPSGLVERVGAGSGTGTMGVR